MEMDSTLGFLEIGVLVSGILFGIFTMQVYIYHKNFSKDPGWTKYGLACVFDALIATLVVIRVATDIVISTALVYYLHKSRSNALHSSMVIVDKLMQWAIETGIVTSMVNILLMICLLINVNNYLWVAFYVILPKVFSNAMLANLNSRMKFRNMQTIVVGEMVTVPSSGTSTQGTSELQTNLSKIATIHGESMTEEGHQFAV
ncbi:uncharacterized protein C8R40DRAFT_1070357 [Lentinula edodes]|uniref:uncharacterized protein n=1 Tax=Lentinula edodes TaxID=5353 RepID=UPI001E8DB8C6|nr:uncharacterized protein C8R40DRAFT_1070357 [Lentinula edodes]KAH7874209.1 hypothetical protein C8R40DRAFT_1070357 [Lentinula edodes]